MLEKFKKAKSKEIDNLKNTMGNGTLSMPAAHGRPQFSEALVQPRNGKIAIIAEYKRASPSLGPINPGITIEEVTKQYAEAGADALSILTEEEFFMGDFAFLDAAAKICSLPILRKDFIFDPLQVKQTALSAVSALLLIVRLTPNAQVLKNLRELAASYGIESVVEVFDKNDLQTARESGAKIIQVNARDLATLQVDRGACLSLIENNKPRQDEIWIAASGMDNAQHLLQAANAGYKAALVGTALMKKSHPGEALRQLIKGIEQK